jgi:hypothetical protein
MLQVRRIGYNYVYNANARQRVHLGPSGGGVGAAGGVTRDEGRLWQAH